MYVLCLDQKVCYSILCISYPFQKLERKNEFPISIFICVSRNYKTKKTWNQFKFSSYCVIEKVLFTVLEIETVAIENYM